MVQSAAALQVASRLLWRLCSRVMSWALQAHVATVMHVTGRSASDSSVTFLGANYGLVARRTRGMHMDLLGSGARCTVIEEFAVFWIALTRPGEGLRRRTTGDLQGCGAAGMEVQHAKWRAARGKLKGASVKQMMLVLQASAAGNTSPGPRLNQRGPLKSCGRSQSQAPRVTQIGSLQRCR